MVFGKPSLSYSWLNHNPLLRDSVLRNHARPSSRGFTDTAALLLGRQSLSRKALTKSLASTVHPLLWRESRQQSSKTPLAAEHPRYQRPQRGFLSILPPSWVPYAELMRLEKTGGLYGFYFPYLIGIGYAASVTQPIPSPSFVLSTGAIFLAWTVLLRGAVCTINDNLDREFDRKVARCRSRPIARGAVTPVQGHLWFVAQSIAAAVVATQLPHATQCFYHAIPIHSLLSVYPLAKRVTDFPQVVLSIPLAWAVFMSCSAFGLDIFTMQNAALTSASACLFVSQAVWIIMLDYVNACQDTADDIKAGVRSMAVRYQNTSAFLTVLSVAQVALMTAAGLLGGMSPVYFTTACGGNAVILAAMVKTVDRARSDICAWWFLRGSILVGGTTVIGLFGEYFMKLRNERQENLVEK